MFEFLKLEMLSGDIYKQVTAAAVFLPRRCLVLRIVDSHSLAPHSPCLGEEDGGGGDDCSASSAAPPKLCTA